MDYQDLLIIAVNTAKYAGEILAEQNGSSVLFEEGHDIKLYEDKESEKRIFDLLSMTNINILSEEAGYIELNKDSTLRWIVDPLDGSLNYFHHIPICCVSIALWKADEPIFGVIYDFVHKDLYQGGKNIISTLNGKVIRVSNVEQKSKSIIATGFPVYSSFNDKSLMQFITKIKSYKKVRLFGSAAFSLCMVAQGCVEAYEENNIAWWDVAAGIPIVIGAGGIVNIKNTDTRRYLMAVYASNGKI